MHLCIAQVAKLRRGAAGIPCMAGCWTEHFPKSLQPVLFKLQHLAHDAADVDVLKACCRYSPCTLRAQLFAHDCKNGWLAANVTECCVHIGPHWRVHFAVDAHLTLGYMKCGWGPPDLAYHCDIDIKAVVDDVPATSRTRFMVMNVTVDPLDHDYMLALAGGLYDALRSPVGAGHCH